jgi:hypothetical protein
LVKDSIKEGLLEEEKHSQSLLISDNKNKKHFSFQSPNKKFKEDVNLG